MLGWDSFDVGLDCSGVIFQNKVCSFFVMWEESTATSLITDILYFEISRQYEYVYCYNLEATGVGI